MVTPEELLLGGELSMVTAALTCEFWLLLSMVTAEELLLGAELSMIVVLVGTLRGPLLSITTMF